MADATNDVTGSETTGRVDPDEARRPVAIAPDEVLGAKPGRVDARRGGDRVGQRAGQGPAHRLHGQDAARRGAGRRRWTRRAGCGCGRSTSSRSATSSEGLSPDLVAELDRMAPPFDDEAPSEAELRIAQAQLVGWLEGLFHGIQATLMSQQMAARAQLEEMRQRGLPRGRAGRTRAHLGPAPTSEPADRPPAPHRAPWSESHPCNWSTGCGPSDGSCHPVAPRVRTWRKEGRCRSGRSRICTPTPSSPCSTGRPGSATSCAAAVADGQPALGITDHGNMYGVLDFYKACRDQGITPVIGTEAYMAGESRHERPVRRGQVDDTGGDVEGGQKLYYHLTLLAETDRGLPQPVEAVLGRLPRGLLLQAPASTGSCSSATTTG